MAGDEEYDRELFFHEDDDHNLFETLRGFDLHEPPPFISFDDYLRTGSRHVFGSGELQTPDEQVMVDGATNSSNNLTPSTGGGASPASPNSSADSSSTEAAGEENSVRCKDRPQQEAKAHADEADSTDKLKKLA